MTNDHNKLNVNINDVALIFEGGGMRGIYTAGVLDAMDEDDDVQNVWHNWDND